MVRHLHDIAGGAVLTSPTLGDLDNPDTGPFVEKYMSTMEGVPAEERIRLFHAIRDLTADALGGWHLVTNLQSGGGLFAQRIVARKHYDMNRAKDFAVGGGRAQVLRYSEGRSIHIDCRPSTSTGGEQMPLKDELTAFLTEMAESGVKPIAESTPEEVRALVAELKGLYGAGPEMARVEDDVIKTEDGDSFDVRVLVPEGPLRGVLIYYHGGGWVIGGDIDEFDTLGRKLAVATRCAIVLPNYRLAPEFRYPTAVFDAYATLEWVAVRVSDIAGAEVPVIVAGDSAGGNLAAVVSQRSRNRGGPEIAFQALVYPVTDANLETQSYTAEENQLMLNKESMVWFWGHYLPETERRAEIDASPLQAPDVAGLPPAVVITAEYDVLRDEGEAYAARLSDAGVPVDLHRHEGQMHGFFTLLMVPGHEEAIEQIAKSLDTRLGATVPS